MSYFVQIQGLTLRVAARLKTKITMVAELLRRRVPYVGRHDDVEDDTERQGTTEGSVPEHGRSGAELAEPANGTSSDDSTRRMYPCRAGQCRVAPLVGDRCYVGLLPRPSTIDPVTVTLDLPAEAEARLQAEANRRGVTLDQLVAELANQLPAESGMPKHRLGFVGIGASGRTEPLDIHRERADLAAKKFAEGI